MKSSVTQNLKKGRVVHSANKIFVNKTFKGIIADKMKIFIDKEGLKIVCDKCILSVDLVNL